MGARNQLIQGFLEQTRTKSNTKTVTLVKKTLAKLAQGISFICLNIWQLMTSTIDASTIVLTISSKGL